MDADAIDTDAGVIDPFDLCVWAGGFSVPGLAADAGLKVDDQRRVLTDTTLRSVADPPIYRVSDVAAVPGPWGCSLAMGCRTGGFIGSVAADNIVARLSGGKPRGFSSGTSTSASASAGSDT